MAEPGCFHSLKRSAWRSAEHSARCPDPPNKFVRRVEAQAPALLSSLIAWAVAGRATFSSADSRRSSAFRVMRLPPVFSRSTAISTRSGVAGASRRGQMAVVGDAGDGIRQRMQHGPCQQ